jgi:predicted ATP-dependent serine protease
MKVLGVVQFRQKKFKILGVEEPWLSIFGDLPDAFIGIVYGQPGNGKTEFLMQFAAYLTRFGKVAWLAYEQGHAKDFQDAMNRNITDDMIGKFLAIDPEEERDESLTLFQELCNYIDRRNSPQFYFIDSYDYTAFTWEEIKELKLLCKKKRKTIIFISHSEGKRPKTVNGRRIEHDGAFGIFVSKFIAYVHKNRFGGMEDFIVYEKAARKKNPLYFQQKDEAEEREKAAEKVLQTKRKKRRAPAGNVDGFDNNEPRNFDDEVDDE